MRLVEFFHMLTETEFLVERDVLNAKELKAWAKQQAARVQFPKAQSWLASQLYKYLINRYDDQQGIEVITQPPEGAPDWMIAKLQQGEAIYNITTTPELQAEVAGVADWLNAELQQNPNQDIRITWEDAVESQKEWHEESKRMNRVTELSDEEMEGIVTVREYKNGFRWVDVQTEVCLKHEGTMMGHCVGQGGYTQGVSEGTTKIFSLRNAKGLAHVTIEAIAAEPVRIVPHDANEVDDRQLSLFKGELPMGPDLTGLSVKQIKGKENKPPVAKYREYVKDFLNWGKISKFDTYGNNDLERMGLYRTKNHGYATLDEVTVPKAKLDDGSTWVVLDQSQLVPPDKESWDDSKGLSHRWYLIDKKKNTLGQAGQESSGQIKNIEIPFNVWRQNADYKKYAEHVKALFSTGVQPNDQWILGHFKNPLSRYGLAMDKMGNVGYPQEVGNKLGTTSVGDVYQTHEPGFIFWVMNGKNVVTKPEIREKRMSFDQDFGTPDGNFGQFVKEFTKAISTSVDEIQMPGGNTIPIGLLEREPPSPTHDNVFFKADDGVTWFYAKSDDTEHFQGFDEHGNQVASFDPKSLEWQGFVVRNAQQLGYHLIYLFEELETEQEVGLGQYGRYDSKARDFLDETQWFRSEVHGRFSNLTSSEWFIMSDDAPINYTRREWDEDGNDTEDEQESTMGDFWTETSLDGSGMEQDWFAEQYERLYSGYAIEWEDEWEGEDGERRVIDHIAEFTGDSADYSHPASGGNWKP